MSGKMKMKMKKSPPPSWMGLWLETPMYGEGCKCSKHSGSYTTVFCGECLGRPHCQKCWHNDGDSQPHQNHHPILQARIASRRTAITPENIRDLWDVSDIQIYQINHKTILHLEPNKSASSSPPGGRKRPRDDQNPRCLKCTTKLLESKYSFCSIACKYDYVTSPVAIEERHMTNIQKVNIPKVRCDDYVTCYGVTCSDAIRIEERHTNIPKVQQLLTRPHTFRKRSRKGIPSRAPFY